MNFVTLFRIYHNLSQLVYEHTRTGINGSSSTLDLILTNYPEEINNVEAAPGLVNSDHSLVCFNIPKFIDNSKYYVLCIILKMLILPHSN